MLGLITEYNPFHNGHLFHLNKSKEVSKEDSTIVVMSGNFVQRGEPSIFNKHIRTKMALLNGADIVLELPLIFAASGTALFALGAVDLLDKTNLVTKICFGSETADIEIFKEIASIFVDEPEDFKLILKNELKKGASYPLSRANAVKIFLNRDTGFLETPNNILGIEYVTALKKLNSNIIPITIGRKDVPFHSLGIKGNVASATAIRKFLREDKLLEVKKCIPDNCFKIINSLTPLKLMDIDDYSDVLNYVLRFSSASDIKNIADVTEGLENRMLKGINSENFKITEFINFIKTKRYTRAKLQKAILHIILNITKKEQNKVLKNGLNQYIRVLGFKKQSEHLVSKLCSLAKVPVIMNINKDIKNLNPEGIFILEKEIKSTDIFYFKSNIGVGREYMEPLVIV